MVCLCEPGALCGFARNRFFILRLNRSFQAGSTLIRSQVQDCIAARGRGVSYGFRGRLDFNSVSVEYLSASMQLSVLMCILMPEWRKCVVSQPHFGTLSVPSRGDPADAESRRSRTDDQRVKAAISQSQVI
jgi:hypothetical protein